MQNPAEINDNIDLILSQIDDFAKEGLAQDAWQAHHRHHYLKAATMLLADWRKAEPCPIRYARFYARQRVFAQKLTSLAHLIFDDFDHFGIAAGDPDYLKPPKPSFQYLCDEDDVVAEVIEEEGCPSWPQIPHFLMPEELRIEPAFYVGDTWGRSSLEPMVKVPTEGAVPPPKEPSPVVPQTPALPGSSPLTSLLLQKFLAVRLEDTGTAIAESDVKPYVLFAIHIMGDKPIQDYTRDNIRLLCLSMSEVLTSKGIEAQSLVDRFEYAKANGWEGLTRLSSRRLKIVMRVPTSAFGNGRRKPSSLMATFRNSD